MLFSQDHHAWGNGAEMTFFWTDVLWPKTLLQGMQASLPKKASSAEFVGEFWFGKMPKLMLQRGFDSFKGAKAEGFSCSVWL